MKKIINKTTMAVILLLSMALALLGGIFFARQNSETASAEGTLTTVDVTADTTSFFPGATFTLTVKLETNRQDMLLSTVSLNIGPRTAGKDQFDTDQCALLTFSDLVVDSKLDKYKNNNAFMSSGQETNGLLKLSATYDNKEPVAAPNYIEYTVNVKIDENVAPGTEFDVGIRLHTSNRAAFRNMANAVASAVYDTSVQSTNPKTDTIIQSTSLAIKIKNPSDNNKLASLMAGQGTLSKPDDVIDFSDPDNMNVTVKDPSSPLDIELATEDEGATVELMPGNIPVVDGKGSIAIPSDGIVTIVVTAENGTPKSYKLKVKVVGAMLTALTANPDTKTAGVNKGVKETFASSTTAYTVIIPNDSTKVTLNATVSTGNSAQSTMDIFSADGCTVPATATSGDDFDVTNISDGDKMTITCKASDGTTNSSKSYDITFDVVDVNANLDTITAKGATTNQTYTSSAKRATANSVDYYYLVVGESNASAKVTVVAESSAATISMDSASYNENAVLTEGKHTVTVTAEAGNSLDYTFYLKNYVGLEIKDGKVADFVFEEELDGSSYRRTYTAGRQEAGKEGSLVHGIDDIDFERIVIGQISNLTNVNTFLDNFKDTSKIKLYTFEDELLYDLGNCAIDDPDELDDADCYSVGTGWYIEFVVNGTVEETIYISVIGDLDGSGMFSAEDITMFGRSIRGVLTFDSVELRLAAYVVNFGEISADDIAAVIDFIKKQAKSSDYFAN